MPKCFKCGKDGPVAFCGPNSEVICMSCDMNGTELHTGHTYDPPPGFIMTIGDALKLIAQLETRVEQLEAAAVDMNRRLKGLENKDKE